MQKGVQSRLIAHIMLHNIKEKNTNFDEIFNIQIEKNKISKKDINLIQNIVLTSMRYDLYVKKIIKKYILKKITSTQSILFLSAITQIVYLDFKDYAVVNSTVELAKNKNINVYPGFVNAVLKNIIKDREILKKLKIEFSDLPNWFVKNSANISFIKKKEFIETIIEKPNIHLVFKDEKIKKTFKGYRTSTSNKSLIIKNMEEIESLPGYNRGEWWIQDYSAMLPLFFTENLESKRVLDMCAAPGGKAFQALTAGANVTLIEKNKKRALILSKNLKRLQFKNEIIISDALDINTSKKFDYVLIDAPCSAVGTIRRNPEIFFRKNEIIFENLIEIQKNLLNKAAKLVSSEGIIIYMVCSFIKTETKQQVNNFLQIHKNFKIYPYSKDLDKYNLIDNDGCINIMPRKIEDYNIDGFFSVRLKKND